MTSDGQPGDNDLHLSNHLPSSEIKTLQTAEEPGGHVMWWAMCCCSSSY